MSKIICDVCGTAYPETASQCPICGTAKSDAAKPVAGDTAAEGAAGYAYVKGGRFSHSNVKKRNAGKKELPRTVVPAKPKKEEPQEKPARQERSHRKEKERPASNLGLVIIVIILVLAIIAVCAYIAIRFIDFNGGWGKDPSGTHSTADPTGGTNPATSQQIPCTGVRLPVPEHSFTAAGEVLHLEPTLQPANTTDKVVYTSSDPFIASVDADGKVTAIANGQVTITVTCGDFTATCQITCDVGVDPTYPTEPTDPTDPTQPTPPDVPLELNRTDFTLSGYGASWNVYSGELNAADITWTSDDPEVATVENGKVTAVGNGSTTIRAEYLGQQVACIVHCKNVERPADTNYEVRTIYGPASDITIKVGETLTLQLVDKESGLRISADKLTFSVQKEGYVTVDEKGRVTGVSTNSGGIYVYIEYEGETYKCLVRVRSAS